MSSEMGIWGRVCASKARYSNLRGRSNPRPAALSRRVRVSWAPLASHGRGGVLRLRRALLFCAPKHLRMTCGANRLDHLEQSLSHAGLPNFIVGTDQLKRFSSYQRVLLLLEGCGFLPNVLPVASAQGIGGHLLEEMRDGHIQDLCEFHKTAGTDPVRPTFVLLDLLEREVDGIAQRRLRHAQ